MPAGIYVRKLPSPERWNDGRRSSSPIRIRKAVEKKQPENATVAIKVQSPKPENIQLPEVSEKKSKLSHSEGGDGRNRRNGRVVQVRAPKKVSPDSPRVPISKAGRGHETTAAKVTKYKEPGEGIGKALQPLAKVAPRSRSATMVSVMKGANARDNAVTRNPSISSKIHPIGRDVILTRERSQVLDEFIKSTYQVAKDSYKGGERHVTSPAELVDQKLRQRVVDMVKRYNKELYSSRHTLKEAKKVVNRDLAKAYPLPMFDQDYINEHGDPSWYNYFGEGIKRACKAVFVSFLGRGIVVPVSKVIGDMAWTVLLPSAVKSVQNWDVKSGANEAIQRAWRHYMPYSLQAAFRFSDFDFGDDAIPTSFSDLTARAKDIPAKTKQTKDNVIDYFKNFDKDKLLITLNELQDLFNDSMSYALSEFGYPQDPKR
ncbi:MAG: hypothetical protein HUJ99_00220, partial [Bacteroidaceae bacterium]|nr:hypothetical protein [Bacteroidaceae bacterium]